MEKILRVRKKVLIWFKKLPSKKIYLEFLTALIGVPVAITWLILNINSVHNLYAPKVTPTPTPGSPEKVIVVPQNANNNTAPISTTPIPTNDPTTCTQQIGPISISSPTENETVSNNPVMVVIDYDQGSYCSVVWSYQINNGPWSSYSNDSVALYNLPQGDNTFNLMVKSTVTSQTTTLTRDFIYIGTQNAVPTSTIGISPTQVPTLTPQVAQPTQVSSPSANNISQL